MHGSQTSPITRINGKIKDVEIANDFAAGFEKVCNDANSYRSEFLSGQFHDLYSKHYNDHRYEDLNSYFLSWADMVNVMSKLKPGKSSANFIRADHILNGSPKFLTR